MLVVAYDNVIMPVKNAEENDEIIEQFSGGNSGLLTSKRSAE